MELSRFRIIKGPIVSDKAYRLNREKNQLVLDVDPKATKKQIKDAIESLFNVKVKAVNTSLRKETTARAASRRHKARPTVSKRKIAYVTLAEGYTLNLFDQAGSNSTQIEHSEPNA
jgi:large subunit ribosomal protein L23